MIRSQKACCIAPTAGEVLLRAPSRCDFENSDEIDLCRNNAGEKVVMIAAQCIDVEDYRYVRRESSAQWHLQLLGSAEMRRGLRSGSCNSDIFAHRAALITPQLHFFTRKQSIPIDQRPCRRPSQRRGCTWATWTSHPARPTLQARH